MKRIAAVLILCLTLCGCGKEAPAGDAGGLTAEPEQTAAQGIFELKRLVKGNPSSCNSLGAYTYKQQYPNEYTAYFKLSYTDFETAETSACCDIDGCAHNTPDCAAWHYWGTATSVCPTDNALIWVQENDTSDAMNGDAPLPTKISVSGLDGLNPREIKVFEYGTVGDVKVSKMLYDERYLYMLYQLYSDAPGIDNHFLKLDVSSGETVFDVPITVDGAPQTYIGYGGSYGADMLFSTAANPDAYTYYTLSPDTGECKMLLEISSAAFGDKYANWTTPQNGAFNAVTKDLERYVGVDMFTLEETELFTFGDALKGWDWVSVKEFDGHYIVTALK